VVDFDAMIQCGANVLMRKECSIISMFKYIVQFRQYGLGQVSLTLSQDP